MAEHDGVLAGVLVGEHEVPTELGMNAEDAEKVRGDDVSFEDSSGASGIGEGGRVVVICGDGAKGVILAAPVEEIGEAETLRRECSCPVVLVLETHEPVGLGEWQRTQQNRVDQAEDAGGCADSESQGEDGGEGEARAFAQLAYGETKVLKKIVHGSSAKEGARGWPSQRRLNIRECVA